MTARELVMVAALVVAGCDRGGGGSKDGTAKGSSEAPSSLRSAAGEIAKAGIGCDDLVTQEPGQDEPVPAPRELGRCTIGGVTLQIRGYESPAVVQAVVAAHTTGCGFNRQRRLNERAVVVAGAQILELEDGNVDVSNQIAGALGGEVRTLRC